MVPDRIVCAVDMSEVSVEAVRTGAALARRFDLPLQVCYVMEVPWSGYFLEPFEPAIYARYQDLWALARSEAKESLQEFLAENARAVRPEEAEILEGEPVAGLLDHAEPTDLLVIGSHGRSGASRLLLGSVAEGVARRSPCPVLICKPDQRSLVGRDDEGHIEIRAGRVLLATDLQPTSRPAARMAVAMTRRLDARLTVLHVVRDVAPDHASESIREELREAASELATGAEDVAQDELATVLEETGPLPSESVEVICRPGRPREAILEVAREEDAALLVLGTHGRRGVKRLVLGSVAEHVARASPVPVLLARGNDPDEAEE